ncbi:MAG: TOBE domain-containing protein, partial [Fimbriimonadales bacterium]
LGITTLYVTHDQKEAMTLGTRIAVMKEGVLQQVGTPDEVYFHPANTFVATFIGTPPMNLLHAQVIAHDGRPALRVGSTTLPVLESHAQKLRARVGQGVLMGIRPQDLYTDRTAPPDAILSEPVPAVVDVVEPHGDRNDVHLLVDGATLIAQLSARVKVNEGDPIALRLHLEYLHLFDLTTGEAL